jgi:hypothetical protein
MLKRPISIFLKHVVAMELILKMQDDKGTLPNVEYVKTNPKPLGIHEFARDRKRLHFDYLQDMFLLVAPPVYDAFHKILNDSKSLPETSEPVNVNTILTHTKFGSAMLHALSLNADVAFWDGGYPHPCSPVMREVVADLLGEEMPHRLTERGLRL